MATRSIHDRLISIEDKVNWLTAEHERAAHLQYRDTIILLNRVAPFMNTMKFKVETDYPLAVDSDDHKFPRGTRFDNTRSPRFVAACERRFPEQIRYLDLGCSGGGLVFDFLLRGHIAAGLEGSDYSKRALRAEWRVIPNHLMVCDISKPFRVSCDDNPAVFDVITAWEVLEHIDRDDLGQLMNNIKSHLSEEGIFVGSVTTIQDADAQTGALYHRTVEPKEWWIRKFNELGWEEVKDHPFSFRDFCRGTGNGWFDVDLTDVPDTGFHCVLRPIRGRS